MHNLLKVSEILNMISQEDLDRISCETQVDKNVKKIKGKYIFSMFLYGFLNPTNNSLQKMINTFNSFEFKLMSGLSLSKNYKMKHKSSLSMRLSNIEYKFFEKIFKELVDKYSKKLPKIAKEEILRFDSTLLTLSSKLLGEVGYSAYNQNGETSKKQIKFTVSMNRLAKSVDFFSKKSHNSEEVALKEAILNNSEAGEEIVVFDRGIRSRDSYCRFDEENISFITRGSKDINYKKIRSNTKKNNDSRLKIISDEIVFLSNRKKLWIEREFRLIKVQRLSDDKNFTFITNRFDLSSIEVCNIYKRRWDIEVFFKFIKQNLHAKHFLSHNLNGIQVTFYMILILSLMLMIYKIRNKINSYKDAIFWFNEGLKRQIYKAVAVMTGGNPLLIDDS